MFVRDKLSQERNPTTHTEAGDVGISSGLVTSI